MEERENEPTVYFQRMYPIEQVIEAMERMANLSEESEVKNMSNKDFVKVVVDSVVEYANDHIDKTDKRTITADDVFIVWLCKTLQNHKALASTTLYDGMYYEVTYNGDKDEVYFDAYKKWENKCIKLKESEV